jgi:hypothetical protein
LVDPWEAGSKQVLGLFYKVIIYFAEFGVLLEGSHSNKNNEYSRGTSMERRTTTRRPSGIVGRYIESK